MISRKKYYYTVAQDIKRGHDSNFSWCCIFWFLLRLSFTLIRNFDDKLTEKYQFHANHVLCPFCRLRYFFFKKKIKYTRCERCDWTQFNKLRCNLCGRIPRWPKSSCVYSKWIQASGDKYEELKDFTAVRINLGERNDID